jgi:hypothetical protein
MKVIKSKLKVNESNHQARPVYCGFNLIERDELRLLDRFVPRTDVRKRLKRNESARELLGVNAVVLQLFKEEKDDSVGATTNEKRFSQMCQEIRKF